MTLGAAELLKKYDGDRVRLAMALVDGSMDSYDQQRADELLDESIRWAAELRIRIRENQKVGNEQRL